MKPAKPIGATTVALVTPYYPPKIGGVERYVAQLAQGLAAGGDFTPVVITTRPSGKRTVTAVEDGVFVIRLGIWLRVSNTPLSPLWPFQVRRWLRRTGASIVNAHAPVPGLGDIAVLSAGRRRVVVTYHGGTMHKGVTGSGLADRIIAAYERWVLPRVFARCDVPVPVGPSSLAAPLPGAELIAPGVDITRFTPGPAAGRRPELVYVGRMERTSRWKGIDVLVDAFVLLKDVPGLRLKLVGEGNAVADHLAQADRLGVRDRVEATGALTGDALVAAIREAAVLVLPSTTNAEVAGTVVIEAMACATPVVASDVGSLAYMLNGGETALIVKPGDTQELAAACRRILTDPALAARLGAAGRARAERQFAWPLVVKRYASLFAGLSEGAADDASGAAAAGTAERSTSTKRATSAR
ncbi:MAG TPA: glycosyltransferase family 4 protein [Actinocrinis sp.]|jgi:glycosyltransferase involved in cell wall biosynthesis